MREIHEGSEDIKEHEKYLLAIKYESFRTEPHEDIDKIYYRFSDIIKDLETLGKIYSPLEKNRQNLNALPKEQETKVMAIEEAKNFNLCLLNHL